MSFADLAVRQAHDGPLAELLFDLGQGGAQGLGFFAACFGVVHVIFPCA